MVWRDDGRYRRGDGGKGRDGSACADRQIEGALPQLALRQGGKTKHMTPVV